MKVLLHIFFASALLSVVSAKAQTQDSTITSIYTDYKSYWTSSTNSNNPVLPDTSHNLLGFKFRNKIYSTGVGDATLAAKLGKSGYSAQLFKALPIKSIGGTVKTGGATNLAFALKNDGDSTKAAYKSPYPNIHIADVLTDGKNGLDLGTGVTNLPKGGHISFTVKNITSKSALDSVPDLVFTQIAEPTSNQPDTVYFADENGNIVGNKKLIYWNSVSRLGTYKLDLYSLTPNVSCNTSIMNGMYEQNGTREIRMVAFLMTEFGITDVTKVSSIKSIQINPNGTSDQAFIAYNTNTINLDVPMITGQPTSQMLCSASNTSATFSVTATGTNITYQWKKNGAAIDGATSASYTATNLKLADTASMFSVTVSNAVSSVTSDNASIKYLIVSQLSSIPTIATGNSISFSGLQTSGATSFQWQKSGVNISGATASGFSIPVVNTDDSGKYRVLISYKDISCTTDATALNTSVVLYSKSSGNLNIASNWGVNTDGSGNSPVSFTRSEHTFVVTNRTSAATGADLTIAGTLDINNANVTITPGTTLTANQIIRSNFIPSQKVPGVFEATPVEMPTSSSGEIYTVDTPVEKEEATPAEEDQPATTETKQDQPATTTKKDQPATTTKEDQPATTETKTQEASAEQDVPYTASGALSVFPTSNLVVGLGTSAAESTLYFDAVNNTIKNLTIAAKAVVLQSALNIAPGKNYGILQINYGTLYTHDLLTLKSDSLGTASVAKSAGRTEGKVTVERWLHARRAWRFMGAPVSSVDAPSINAAWQEGAANSTDNPHPGFGTHITGGTEANGFDKSPTNNASIKYYSEKGTWTALSNTNKTPVTQYPAYMLFVRGNRSYNILSTTTKTTPMTTVLRATGNLIQGKQDAQDVAASGLTMVVNPYACPISFTKLLSYSRNLKKRIYVWDPTLAGNNGVGGWVIVNGTSKDFRITPPSTYASTVLQAGQGFFVETADGVNNGSFQINEDEKDLSGATINGDRVVGSSTDTSLEVNLKLFNADGTASIADGVLYNFGSSNNNAFDANDAGKMYNSGENLSVKDSSGKEFAIDSRTAPKTGDSLRLAIYSLKSASYQFEIVPSLIKNVTFALYDKYLNTFSPVSATDTTRITFSVLSNVAASKAADRFTIITQKGSIQTLPALQPQLTYTQVKAGKSNNAISVEWNVENESAVLYYQVQKSTDNIHFSTIGNVTGSNKGAYAYTDASATTANSSYRIMSVSKSGDNKYSPIVSVQPDNSAAAGVSVYPNPLTGTTFTLTLSGMSAGTYALSVVNSNGATVFSKSITHSGGTASQKVTLNNHLAAGIYYIKTTSADGIVTTVKVSAN